MTDLKRCFYVGVCFLSFAVADLKAANPPESPSSLESKASDVIIGAITDLNVREVPAETDGFTDLELYYTVNVLDVEKGETHAPADEIVVRAVAYKDREGPTGVRVGHGHRPLPPVGSTVRVFLDGEHLLYPNGFCPPTPLETLTPEEFNRSLQQLHSPRLLDKYRGVQTKPHGSRSLLWPLVAAGMLVAGVVLVAVMVKKNRRTKR